MPIINTRPDSNEYFREADVSLKSNTNATEQNGNMTAKIATGNLAVPGPSRYLICLAKQPAPSQAILRLATPTTIYLDP